jgi:hypothetical protein
MPNILMYSRDSNPNQPGVKINPYLDGIFDPVPNIAGFNTLNPFKIIGSLIAIPFLPTDLSPHTNAAGSHVVVQPPPSEQPPVQQALPIYSN